MTKTRVLCVILVMLTLGACNVNRQTGEVAAASPRAVLVPGSGEYSLPISTDSSEAQAFFDQGLRLAWGFYFPESIASYQEAARLDPDHPMPYWGMAHAMGPNPNSRYARMPDDPKNEGLKAISMARALSFNGLANVQLISALNGGSHAAPCFAGDTISAWSEVLDKVETGVPRVGALRLRLVAQKVGAAPFSLTRRPQAQPGGLGARDAQARQIQ